MKNRGKIKEAASKPMATFKTTIKEFLECQRFDLSQTSTSGLLSVFRIHSLTALEQMTGRPLLVEAVSKLKTCFNDCIKRICMLINVKDTHHKS
jgi:hypothetical protein